MKQETQRTISSQFVADLKSGILSEFLAVAQQKGCNLCIRKDYINLYYRGHSLFKIQQKKRAGGYSATFNLNHGRYTQNYADIKNELNMSLDCSINPGHVENKKNNTLTLKITAPIPTDRLKRIIELLQGLIDDFFCKEKKFDYFKNEEKSSKPTHLEKQRQQVIMTANKELTDGYFIYDMEFTQPRNVNDEERLGRFDMLALRSEGGVPKALVFIELKSTKAACAGKCGVKQHKIDLDKYIALPVSQLRIKEMESTLQSLAAVGIIQNLPNSAYSNLEKEILFIFTDEAQKCSVKLPDNETIKLDEPYKLPANQREKAV